MNILKKDSQNNYFNSKKISLNREHRQISQTMALKTQLNSEITCKTN